MLRNLVCVIFIILLLALTGCPGRNNTANAPSYEKIIAPATDVPAEALEGSSQDTSQVDLQPLAEALQNAPNDPFVRFAYLNGLRRAGRSMDALEQARILAATGGEDNPFKSPAYINFAEIVVEEIAPDAPNRAELVREAINGLWVALGWEPESVPAHLLLGKLALEAGDKDKALHHLAIALTAIEIGYELRVEMAKIYLERGDTEKAKAHLGEALTLAENEGDRTSARQIRSMLSQI